MRKYSSIIISLLLVGYLFTFFQVTPIYADAELNEPCGVVGGGYIACDSSQKLVCGPNNTCIVNQDDKKVQPRAICHCLGHGTDNANNFECHLESDASVTGTATCNNNEQCQDVGQDQGVNHDAQNQRGSLFSKGVEMVGIKCAQPVITCHCVSKNMAGGGHNGVKCTFANGADALNNPGSPHVDQIYCNGSDQACTEDPNSTMKPQDFNWYDGIDGDLPDNVDDLQFKGVKCTTPADPTVPPPPTPPCKHWASTGQCELVGSAGFDLSTKPAFFIKTIFSILLSFSGGIALLLIIRSGYKLMTSQGNPEAVKGAREELIAAIVGLAFLIFSFVILQVIGFDILHIKGFGA